MISVKQNRYNSGIDEHLYSIGVQDLSYAKHDFTEYLSRKKDLDGNDVEYELANDLFYFGFNWMKRQRDIDGKA